MSNSAMGETPLLVLNSEPEGDMLGIMCDSPAESDISSTLERARGHTVRPRCRVRERSRPDLIPESHTARQFVPIRVARLLLNRHSQSHPSQFILLGLGLEHSTIPIALYLRALSITLGRLSLALHLHTRQTAAYSRGRPFFPFYRSYIGRLPFLCSRRSTIAFRP